MVVPFLPPDTYFLVSLRALPSHCFHWQETFEHLPFVWKTWYSNERFIPVECFRKKLIPSMPSPNSRKFLYHLFRTRKAISKKTAMPRMADSRDESLPFQPVCYFTAVLLASPLITDFATQLWHSRWARFKFWSSVLAFYFCVNDSACLWV